MNGLVVCLNRTYGLRVYQCCDAMRLCVFSFTFGWKYSIVFVASVRRVFIRLCLPSFLNSYSSREMTEEKKNRMHGRWTTVSDSRRTREMAVREATKERKNVIQSMRFDNFVGFFVVSSNENNCSAVNEPLNFEFSPVFNRKLWHSILSIRFIISWERKRRRRIPGKLNPKIHFSFFLIETAFAIRATQMAGTLEFLNRREQPRRMKRARTTLANERATQVPHKEPEPN